MNIFVAASYARKREAAMLADQLRGAGHVIFSRWVEAEGHTYVCEDDSMRDASRIDMEDLAKCNALVMLNGDNAKNRSRGGKHTELGIAIGKSKRVFVLGPREGIHEWNEQVTVCADLAELLKELGSPGEQAAEPITAEAHRITNKDRRDVYGHPFDDFTRIGDMWAAILGVPVTPEQVGACMIALKLGRLCHSPGHRDSLVDIAGYANCLDYIRQRRATMPAKEFDEYGDVCIRRGAA